MATAALASSSSCHHRSDDWYHWMCRKKWQHLLVLSATFLTSSSSLAFRSLPSATSASFRLSSKVQMSSFTVPSSDMKRNLGYVDVHAHLMHEKFVGKEDDIAQHCIDMGMDHVIINGLEPVSNRQILAFCEKFPGYMVPALGIYPLDAANHFIFTEEDIEEMKKKTTDDPSSTLLPSVNWKHEFPRPRRFNVDEEIDFIEEMIQQKKIIAIGECGLDKHYLTDDVSFAEQERVLRKLMKLGVQYDIPLILHTRKAEKKVFEMLVEEGVKKADFHCFCGKKQACIHCIRCL